MKLTSANLIATAAFYLLVCLLFSCDDSPRELESAILSGDAAKVSSLIRDYRDADVIVDSGRQWTALQLAAQYNEIEIMQILLDHGADINYSSGLGTFALAVAAGYGNTEAVRFLLEHGADVNQSTDTGWTALHTAALHGYTEVCIELLDNGARTDLKTNNGQTAIDLAQYAGFQDLVTILGQYE